MILERAIKFAKDFKDDETVHITKLKECAYDSHEGLIIFLDHPYKEKFDIEEFSNRLKTHK